MVNFYIPIMRNPIKVSVDGLIRFRIFVVFHWLLKKCVCIRDLIIWINNYTQNQYLVINAWHY